MSEIQEFTFTLEQREDYAFLIRFDPEGMSPLVTDEPPPLGKGEGPNPSRLLAASVVNCLAASLLFSLRKFNNRSEPLTATVTTRMGRNEDKRLRVQEMHVDLRLGAVAADLAHLDRALAQFEDFCVVTQSVRQGFPVAVRVHDATGTLLRGE